VKKHALNNQTRRIEMISLKKCSLMLFVLFFSMINYVVAQSWIVDLDVSENSVFKKKLQFGVHPGATAGIDSSLGEEELPPLPPSGIFDARFTGDPLVVGNGLDLDIRDNSISQKEYTINLQREAPADSITLSWGTLPAGEFILQDMFGGVIFNINMTTQNSYTITNPGILQFKIKATPVAEAVETVSTPTSITGADSTIAGKDESYTAGGAASNLGHTVEYRFDWGDGNISPWGNAVRSHIWSASGTYGIKSQARCVADTAKVSSWSGDLVSVTVSYFTLTVSVNPGGSGSIAKNPDKAGYSYGDVVELTATANAGYGFDNWSGDAAGSANPLSIIMDTNKAITGNFVEESVSVPTSVSGATATIAGKSESYTSGGAASNFGHTVEYRYDWGDGNISSWGVAVQSHIWAAVGSYAIKSQARCAVDTMIVSAWSGDLTNVTVSYLTLSVSVSPAGTGSVEKNPDKAGYSYGEVVELTATANTGYSFGSWNGDINKNTYPKVNVTMVMNRMIIAEFIDFQSIEPVEVPETVLTPTSVSGAASAIAGKSESYTAGGAASNLDNEVEYRYDWGDGIISSWGKGIRSHIWATEGTYEIKVQARSTADTVVVSLWSGSLASVAVSYLTLDVSVNPAGAGSITKNPDKVGYSYGDVVEITAAANAGYGFGNWGGDAATSTNPLSFTIVTNKNIIANFIMMEEVSGPASVSGEDSTIAGKSENYTAGGAVSNVGHTVEYRFDWGDGNISPWGNVVRSHIWSASGTYGIKSQARCAADTVTVSSWSDNLMSVTISYLTLNVSVNPGGAGSVARNPDKVGYSYGDVVEVTALADQIYIFDKWSGDRSDTTPVISVNMTTDMTLIANFYFLLDPPGKVLAYDVPNDQGYHIGLKWEPSPSESKGLVSYYRIYRSRSGEFNEVISLNQITSVDSLISKEKMYTILIDSVAVGKQEFIDTVPCNNVPYYYWIQAVSTSGLSKPAISSWGNSPLSVYEPVQYKISTPFPNPFNPSTTLRYDVPKECHIQLIIFDTLGRRVRVLEDRIVGPGSYKVTWNAKDESGLSLGSGIYLYKFKAEDYVASGKIMLLR
jgi:hypothetical protein